MKMEVFEGNFLKVKSYDNNVSYHNVNANILGREIGNSITKVFGTVIELTDENNSYQIFFNSSEENVADKFIELAVKIFNVKYDNKKKYIFDAEREFNRIKQMDKEYFGGNN